MSESADETTKSAAEEREGVEAPAIVASAPPSVDSEDENDEDAETALKLVLVGDVCSGKTSLCNKFTQHLFQSKYTATSGVDFYSKRIALPEKKHVLLQLWDVGGHNIGSPSMLQTYLFGAQAVLFVYDVTNTQSFENVCDWICVIKKIARQMEKPFNMFLVGSKTDMEHRRVVSIEKNNRAAEQYALDPFYVSAKTGDNLELMFKTISAKILGVRMSRAEQEWNIGVVQAPITSDGAHYGARSLYQHSYYKNIGSMPLSRNNISKEPKNTKAAGKEDAKICAPPNPASQLKPVMQNRNSAVCTIS